LYFENEYASVDVRPIKNIHYFNDK